MKIITLDLETTGIDWQKAKITLAGYRIDRKGEVIYVPVDSVDPILASYLADPNNILCGHNIKFDALVLAKLGYSLNCHLEDTRVMAYICWPTEESHGLKELIRRKLNGNPVSLGGLLFKPLVRELHHLRNYQSYYFQMDDGKWVRKDLLEAYHKEDIYNTDRLRALMIPPKWYWDVEYPLTKILFEAEFYGCPLDLPYLELLKYEFESRASALFDKIKPAEGEFNPNSTKQVQERLKSLGVDLEKLAQRNDKGDGYSVDADFLKKLWWRGKEGAEFAKNLSEYRRLTKIIGTYLIPFADGARRDGRIHGSINQAGSEDMYGDGSRGTNTGRLSSSDPNLQNIPARTKDGKKTRKAFIPSEGWFMFNSDLKQIEPRLVGHYSQSPKLIKAYADNADTHALFAADIFNRPLADYSEENLEKFKNLKDERFIGKTSWLATAYKCSYKKLLYICEKYSDNPLNIDLKPFERAFNELPQTHGNRKFCWPSCQSCIRKEFWDDAEIVAAKWAFFKRVQDRFKQTNPEIMEWSQDCIDRARKLGYIVTFGGRRIPLPEINSEDRQIRAKAERKAINTPIQGSCADLMKMILVRLYGKLGNDGRIFAPVHDETLGEIRRPEMIEIIRDCMENTVQLKGIKIDSDTKLVNNWSEKK